MDITNRIKQHKEGIIWTLVFHLVFVFIFIFMGFSTPLPLPEETSDILINWGTDNEGKDVIEPPKADIVKTQEIVKENDSEEIITSDIEETVVVETTPKKPKVKKEVKPDIVEDVEPKEEIREVNTQALFPGKSNSTSNSGEGETGKSGNQGSEEGSINSISHIGGATGGNGTSWSLKGRKVEKLPMPTYTENDEGIVAVEITVNKQGKVTIAKAGAKGTTVNNKTLWRLAVEAAKKAKFNYVSDPNTAAYQRGIIKYHFVLR